MPAASQCAPGCAPGFSIRGAKVGTAGLGGAKSQFPRPLRWQARLSHEARLERREDRVRVQTVDSGAKVAHAGAKGAQVVGLVGVVAAGVVAGVTRRRRQAK